MCQLERQKWMTLWQPFQETIESWHKEPKQWCKRDLKMEAFLPFLQMSVSRATRAYHQVCGLRFKSVLLKDALEVSDLLW